MATVRDAKELGEVIKRGAYPICIEDKDAIGSIESIRRPGDFVWAGCVGAVCGLGLMFTSPLGYATGLGIGPGMLCVAGVGASVPIAVLGQKAGWLGVNVFRYGGSKSAVNALRAKTFRNKNDKYAYLG